MLSSSDPEGITSSLFNKPGDMGLQNYHQASTLLVHQGFSQQDASHYHASPGLSLNSLQSMAPSSVPTASLGQFVISSTPQTQAHNDMGEFAIALEHRGLCDPNCFLS